MSLLPFGCSTRYSAIMQTREFHSEWITIGDHRILFKGRDGFPSETMRFMAQIGVETCEAAQAREARVVAVTYFRNHQTDAEQWVVTIASTRREDQFIASRINNALQTIFQRGDRHVALYVIAKPGDVHAEDYNHMRHLSAEAHVLDA